MLHVNSEPRAARPVATWWSLVLSIGILAGIAPLRASANSPDEALTVASLQGTWQLSFMGITGCGFTTMVETAVLDGTGAGKVTSAQSHTAGCGDSISTTASLPFTISHLNPDGSGTGNLSCGPGCGWNLIVQVSENAQMFTAIDVDPVNPGNFVEIVAVRRKKTDDTP
jgi:hypothetical protein